MKRLITIVVLLFSLSAHSQVTEVWRQQFNHFELADEPVSLRLTSHEQVLVLGNSNWWSSDSVRIPGFEILHFDSIGNLIDVVKSDTSLSAEFFGNTLQLCGSEDIYISGTGSNPPNSFDFFLAKYSSDFSFQWIDWHIVPTPFEVADMVCDEFGGIYLTGSSGDSMTLIKYNENGSKQWVEKYSIWGVEDIGKRIRIDEQNDVFFAGTSVLDPIQTSRSVLIKYDSSGSTFWERNYLALGSQSHYVFDMEIDEQGNPHLLVQQDSMGLDLVVVKYSSSGDTLWKKVFDKDSVGTFRELPRDMAVDSQSDIIVTSLSGVDFLNHSVILKYDSTGTLLWSNVSKNENQLGVEGIKLAENDDIIVYGGWQITKFSSSGKMLWSYEIDSIDYIVDLQLSPNGALYVLAAHSEILNTGTDRIIVTLKLSQPGVGIEETGKTISLLKAFPNPAHDFVSIDLTEIKLNSPAFFTIYNHLGQAVRQMNAKNSTSLQIPRNGMPAGIYVGKLSSSDIDYGSVRWVFE